MEESSVVTPAQIKKYVRGQPTAMNKIKDKKLKNAMKRSEKKFANAARKAAEAEILLPQESGYLMAEGMEKTFKFRQDDIVKHVDVLSAKKVFQLDLETFGPYRLDYSMNGRNLLIGGRRGHVATMDWKIGNLGCEIHLGETIRDVHWLHNETMFAVAQKKYVYVYDHTGMELHCMKNHIEVNRMDFLPYHFLLATVGNSGYLRYHDTSTGSLVAQHRTRLGRCDVMAQNPWNAIMHLGHTNGCVTLWSPNITTPLVKMFCHKGPVSAVAIDKSGKYMTTAGLDGQMKIWDLRTYKELHAYYTPTPATSLSISQKGLLAVAHGPRISIWKDALVQKQNSPYMTHLHPSAVIHDLDFVPFDDVLGYSHGTGVGSILVPGSGEPNFDALEANPFQTTKQRQENEVKKLLEKIQPEMISLNPNEIATVDRAHPDKIKEERKLEFEANNPGLKYDRDVHKARGRSSAMRRYQRKQKNVIDEKKMKLKEKLDREKKERERARKLERGELLSDEETAPKSVLNRFKINKK